MLQESRARANAGKLNTQGHAGAAAGGDVWSTRAVGAQMQVGRDARKIVYPGTHAESTYALQAAAVADRHSAQGHAGRAGRGRH